MRTVGGPADQAAHRVEEIPGYVAALRGQIQRQPEVGSGVAWHRDAGDRVAIEDRVDDAAVGVPCQVVLLRDVEPLIEDPVTGARGRRVAQLQTEACCTQAVRPDLGVLTVAALRSCSPLRLKRLVDRAMGVDPAAVGVGHHRERLAPAVLAAYASSEPEHQ